MITHIHVLIPFSPCKSPIIHLITCKSVHVIIVGFIYLIKNKLNQRINQNSPHITLIKLLFLIKININQSTNITRVKSG